MGHRNFLLFCSWSAIIRWDHAIGEHVMRIETTRSRHTVQIDDFTIFSIDCLKKLQRHENRLAANDLRSNLRILRQMPVLVHCLKEVLRV